MSDDKLIFENIESLSLTPGMWTIFKYKMLTAFNAKGWGEHLTLSSDPTNEPVTGDDAAIQDDKAEHCTKQAIQQNEEQGCSC